MKCEEAYENDDGKRFTCDGELQRFDTDTIVCDKCGIRWDKKC